MESPQGLARAPKIPELLSLGAPIWVPQPSEGAFGEQPFPIPYRTPAPTPGNQFCQEEPCFRQHQHPPPEPAPLLFTWHLGPFAELPGDSSKSPCPGSHTPFPTLPQAAPALLPAGSCKPLTLATRGGASQGSKSPISLDCGHYSWGSPHPHNTSFRRGDDTFEAGSESNFPSGDS